MLPNDAHIHLLVNHFPLVAILIGMLVLFTGMLLHKKEIKMVGLAVMLFGSVMSVPAYVSGEGTERVVEDLPGLSHVLIEEHEELAGTGFRIILGLGFLSLVTLIATIRGHQFSKWLLRFSLILSVVALYFLVRIGNSGGKIRHTEIRTDITTPVDTQHEN